ncbi:MAG TPA: class I SAM-dependent methyltransferase [Burkholderiaceae bacterium]|nr:class I SAM-dependent methyltransferase [Burkholderiaceae bacterium]
MKSSSTFRSANGAGYEAQMGRWSRRLAPLLIDFAALDGRGRVLDVGCGTGSLSFALAQLKGLDAIHGIDLSEPYIEHARARNTDARVRFDVANACQLPFGNGAFDHTLSSLVLQFIPDAARAVHEMRRVTRQGGTVAATTWDTRGGHVSFRMFFDTATALDPDAAVRRAEACRRPMARPGGLARAWHEAGMLDVEESSLTIRMEHADFADYWNALDGQDGPYADYLGTLGPAKKAAIREAVRAAYLDGEADGPRSYAATAWAVRGTAP